MGIKHKTSKSAGDKLLASDWNDEHVLEQGLDADKPAAGVAGRLYWAYDTKILYRDNGSAWEKILTLDHGELEGLGDDDHTQYLNTARHDVVDRHPASVIGDLPASKITSGRFPLARMPDGTDGYVLTAKGVGVDPAYEPLATADYVKGETTNLREEHGVKTVTKDGSTTISFATAFSATPVVVVSTSHYTGIPWAVCGEDITTTDFVCANDNVTEINWFAIGAE